MGDATDDGNAKGFVRLVEGQQIAIVFQQHGGLRADLSHEIPGPNKGAKARGEDECIFDWLQSTDVWCPRKGSESNPMA